MIENFNKEMAKLKDITSDVAFVPLDSRQEEWYGFGLERLLNSAKVKYVFPMHFWDKPSVIQQFRATRAVDFMNTIIMDINMEGQKWMIENKS